MSRRLRVATLLLAQALLIPSYGSGADWTLSEAELARLRAGAVLVSADAAGDSAPGDVRAAIQVKASAEWVFRTLTDCSQAMQFVPHLKLCTVLESAPDGSFQVVEQRIDYGWLMPNAYYVFKAEYEPYTRIRYTHVRGDFRENRGLWEFRPTADDSATIVTYRVHVVPRFYVPRWMMRSTLKRDLPALMQGLRDHAEAAGPPPPQVPPPLQAAPH